MPGISDMADRWVIGWLWRFGHFRNPSEPDSRNVTQRDLGKLDLSHRYVQSAIRSIQALDLNCELLCHKHHDRPLQMDGEIGPATLELLTLPRCGIPDYEEASDSAQATGEGSWPVPGCNPNRPNREREHSTRVHIDTSRASARQKSMLAKALRLVEQCEAEIGQHVQHILDDEGRPQEAEHSVKFAYLAGGTIGYAYFPQPGTCNQTVSATIDYSYNPPDELVFATLLEHEYKGHSDGLRHTRGGIMNPSILRLPKLSWRGDPSERIKVRWFGGEPIEDSPNPPTPGPSVIVGYLEGPSKIEGDVFMDGQMFTLRHAGGNRYVPVPREMPPFPA